MDNRVSAVCHCTKEALKINIKGWYKQGYVVLYSSMAIQNVMERWSYEQILTLLDQGYSVVLAVEQMDQRILLKKNDCEDSVLPYRYLYGTIWKKRTPMPVCLPFEMGY